MSDPSRRQPLRLLILLLALVPVLMAGCAGLTEGNGLPAEALVAAPEPTGGGSVQDQLAQLAAGAQPGPGTAVSAAPSGATVSATATRARHEKPPTARPSRTPRATQAHDDALPTIAYAQLPREAHETIRLIQQGGPFPYRQDGATFQNREGRLPKRPSGYYKEYTVVTPGSRDRGARRVIGGEGGELYYTADHYDSFKRVILP